MGFLRRTMPSLAGYRMDIDRVTELGRRPGPGGAGARRSKVEREPVVTRRVPRLRARRLRRADRPRAPSTSAGPRSGRQGVPSGLPRDAAGLRLQRAGRGGDGGRGRAGRGGHGCRLRGCRGTCGRLRPARGGGRGRPVRAGGRAQAGGGRAGRCQGRRALRPARRVGQQRRWRPPRHGGRCVAALRRGSGGPEPAGTLVVRAVHAQGHVGARRRRGDAVNISSVSGLPPLAGRLGLRRGRRPASST